MTYIVRDACVRCKLMDCVEACPTDAFHEGKNMLVINPDECIDCGLCIPECPVDAITEDYKDEPDGRWTVINAKYAKLWPLITKIGKIPPDADLFENETGKFQKYFDPTPGPGDDLNKSST